MWLFVREGFFSVVCARQGDGKRGRPIDPERVMVRARVRAHLEALQARFPELLGGCEIREFPGADYAWRLFVPKSVWAEVVRRLAEDIDYDNFKAATARRQGLDGAAYVEALHAVWRTMLGLQRQQL